MTEFIPDQINARLEALREEQRRLEEIEEQQRIAAEDAARVARERQAQQAEQKEIEKAREQSLRTDVMDNIRAGAKSLAEFLMANECQPHFELTLPTPPEPLLPEHWRKRLRLQASDRIKEEKRYSEAVERSASEAGLVSPIVTWPIRDGRPITGYQSHRYSFGSWASEDTSYWYEGTAREPVYSGKTEYDIFLSASGLLLAGQRGQEHHKQRVLGSGQYFQYEPRETVFDLKTEEFVRVANEEDLLGESSKTIADHDLTDHPIILRWTEAFVAAGTLALTSMAAPPQEQL